MFDNILMTVVDLQILTVVDLQYVSPVFINLDSSFTNIKMSIGNIRKAKTERKKEIYITITIIIVVKRIQ